LVLGGVVVVVVVLGVGVGWGVVFGGWRSDAERAAFQAGIDKAKTYYQKLLAPGRPVADAPVSNARS
jgi:hypothetical protein